MGEVIENDDSMSVSVKEEDNLNVIEPFKFLGTRFDESSLLILNQPIIGVNLVHLWNHTNLHICADGGANRLYEHWSQIGKESCRDEFIPHFIVGDLDSLKVSVRSFYEQKGTIVIPQYTQYASDFMKCMGLVELYFHSETVRSKLSEPIDDHSGLSELLDEVDKVPSQTDRSPVYSYIVNGLGGRFDQTIHSINQTLLLSKRYPHIRNYFVTPDDLVFLLPKGKNYIKYSSKDLFFKSSNGVNPVCGLLPLNGQVALNTRGLKWDVVDWESSMDGRVSSSNALASDNGVFIQCSDDMVINIELTHED